MVHAAPSHSLFLQKYFLYREKENNKTLKKKQIQNEKNFRRRQANYFRKFCTRITKTNINSNAPHLQPNL
jgi:hypothetical protein